MKLPKINDLDLSSKKVLLRVNYDVPLKKDSIWQVADGSRIDESLPTIKFLLQEKAKVILLSHLGRPDGKIDPNLSLKPIVSYLSGKLNKQIPLVDKFDKLPDGDLLMLENLRFWPQEEANDLVFAKTLANLGDFFVNDAFACAHRHHASVVSLPKFLPSAIGFDFQKEMEVLVKIKNEAQRPLVIILGGGKEEKLAKLEKLSGWADNVLIGGKLPEFLDVSVDEKKVKIAILNSDKQDITLESIGLFESIIKQAKTIIWAGPMGVYEKPGSNLGTQRLANAIVESKAFSLVGGGDTEAALSQLNLIEKINYISSGGTAMLEFLADGSLPAIEAILKREANG